MEPSVITFLFPEAGLRGWKEKAEIRDTMVLLSHFIADFWILIGQQESIRSPYQHAPGTDPAEYVFLS